jgi:hypothetical protein
MGRGGGCAGASGHGRGTAARRGAAGAAAAAARVPHRCHAASATAAARLGCVDTSPSSPLGASGPLLDAASITGVSALICGPAIVQLGDVLSTSFGCHGFPTREALVGVPAVACAAAAVQSRSTGPNAAACNRRGINASFDHHKASGLPFLDRIRVFRETARLHGPQLDRQRVASMQSTLSMQRPVAFRTARPAAVRAAPAVARRRGGAVVLASYMSAAAGNSSEDPYKVGRTVHAGRRGKRQGGIAQGRRATPPQGRPPGAAPAAARLCTAHRRSPPPLRPAPFDADRSWVSPRTQTPTPSTARTRSKSSARAATTPKPLASRRLTAKS